MFTSAPLGINLITRTTLNRDKIELLVLADTSHLVVLETQSCGVWVAAVVEEGHGGEDGPAHGNDVELGDVVVLEDALCHLQTIRGRDLKMPGQL